MLNIILFGPPGSGKGTQSKKIIEKFGLIQISTGDLLRNEVMLKTELGLKARELMMTGKLVPDEIVIGMIDNKIRENPGCAGFVFDGFPRNIKQAQILDELFATRKLNIDFVISLIVNEEELIKRILQRGKEQNRFDDQNELIVKNRVKLYFSETKIVSDYYQKQDKFYSLNGENIIDEIFTDICKVIQK
ncbi:MAG: adenylate kinase [Bacteroidetes bacterium]|nr:MAG: adenylate kinase [Bacteroidota bacterium]TAG86103.1 MAG: adenylate kinase [Bacteroidota bacterium]